MKQEFDSRSQAGAERRMNPAPRPYVVLFACVHNAGRSQMAAAFVNRLADPAKAKAVSAGTQLAERVHPVVAEVMREIGIDLSEAQPQRLTTELAAQADLLITMGCGAVRARVEQFLFRKQG